MAVYKIVELGDQVLREKAAPVPEVNAGIQRLLDNLADTMYAARGVGLAAPQIGVSKRAIVVDTGEGLVELVNPEITHRQGEDIDVEGCLSIPGVAGEVRRAAQVEVRGWNREGKSILVRGEGLLARALQHEIDHLDGVLFIDKVIRFIKTREA